MINGVSVSGVVPNSAFQSFKSVFADNSKSKEKFENSPAVQKEIAWFKEQAAKVTSVDDVLKNRRMMEFILSAYSLDDEIKYPGRYKKVLNESVDDKAALANKLSDPRFKEMAKDLRFKELGTGKLKLNYFVDSLVDKFVTNEFEKKLGAQNPALREAAYFKRNADTIKSVYDILGNKVMRSVVTAALGIPPQAALQSVEKQASLVTDKVDIKKFSDPAFVDTFLKKFLIKKDSENSGAALTGKGSELLQLLGGTSGGGINLPTGASRVNVVV
jgi:hypothetical protein